MKAPTPTFKAVAPRTSVWSPGQKHETKRDENPKSDQQNLDKNGEPVSPIWTPKSTNSSPTVERKEFRPVNFQSPVLSRRTRTTSETTGTPENYATEPPWKRPVTSSDVHLNLSTSLDRRIRPSQSTPGFGDFTTSPRLPKAQNPTITLLQKAREGQLPKGAHYIDQEHRPEKKPEIDRSHLSYPGEVLYKIKNEYTSESESEKPKKMTDSTIRKFEGIGPTTKDGMPLILRTEVKDKDQSKWYKRMYDTIHKQKPHKDEYVTVRYKQKRAQYPYTSGYLSEPEPGAYDSDFTEYKYQTLDRRRGPEVQEYTTSTMPRNVPDKCYSSSDIIKHTQPGRIENYVPGSSSISDKEAKRWWDEVMDIFDGHLEQQKNVPPRKSFINQALKESGYESDSTLVFRRKEEANRQLSPKEQKDAYKVIQKGGDVPLHGLRKPAPERPKESDLVEFFPISPTLTRIRIHKNTIKPQTEFLCYPATVHHNVPKTFATYKKTAPSSVSIPIPPPIPPPSPPRRKSSRNNSTLRLISTMKVKTEKSPLCKRHETCFSTDRRKVNYLRDEIICKLSPTSRRKGENPRINVTKKITTTPDMKSRITSSLVTTKDPKKSTRRVQSTTKVSSSYCPRSKSTESVRTLSRSTSTSTVAKKSSNESLNTPIKTFGSEKKKFNLSLPKTTDTRKLPKTPQLLSPTEVKKAVNNQLKSSFANTIYKKSTALLSSARNNGGTSALPIKVGITQKGKNILKSSLNKSPKTIQRTTTQSPCPSTSSERSKTIKSSMESLNSTRIKTKTRKSKINVETKTEKPQNIPKDLVSKPVVLEDIKKQKEAIQSNHFFRHLFLRNISPTPTSHCTTKTWIAQKTEQLKRRTSFTPEPKIGAMKIYLKHTKPVTDSKFISLDTVRSRSTSPKTVTFTNETKNTKRSTSLPPKLVFSETSRPVSPIVTKGIPDTPSRSVSPEIGRKLTQRSPSCRKIMYLKHQQHHHEDDRVLKEKSFKKPPQFTLYMCPSLNQSTTSLDSLKDTKRNEKFKDLSHFYSDIEKLGKLEKTFQLKPRRRCESEIIDYDRWMEVRSRERAEAELGYLYQQLKENEKEKGFLYAPKDLERFKWKSELDRGLRIKEKSVDDIKEEFERMKREESDRENSKRREIAFSKDTYKPLWRGNSVVNLANYMTERRSQSEGRVKTPLQKSSDSQRVLSRGGIGSRIWSSLSLEQVNVLKKQLTDIYNENSKQEKLQDYSVQVPSDVKYVPRLSVRRTSESSKPTITESDKKTILQTLSKEVLENISKKRSTALPLVIGRETLGAHAVKNAIEEPQKEALVKTDVVNIHKTPSASETESGSTDESTRTVIETTGKETLKKKVEYFEKAKEIETYIPTVYKPASPPSPRRNHQSQSCQDIKEYFGEKELAKFATLPLSASKKFNYTKKPQLRALDMSPIRTISEANSYDSLIRSRSLSPYFEETQSLVKRGEVNRLKTKFEYHEDFYGERVLKRSKSDSDLNRRTPTGHVDDMRRRYEYPVRSGRGRSRTRRGGVVSPLFLRAEDRYMPHINIISKIASLYDTKRRKSEKERYKSMEELAEILGCPTGEVEKLKERFEEISLVGRVFTSSPSIQELRDVAPYLTAEWTAHRYPRSEDNTRSLSSPDTSKASRDTSGLRRDTKRARSSPSILKKTEPRYIAEQPVRYKKGWDLKPAVSFKEPETPPPPPPPKGHHGVKETETESPRKYVENEVTIHYKTPVRQEIKEYVNEEELARRQAEAMKKIYEEEKRRKYLQVSKSLQELHDLNSRRHTDNFIPSQKSPISLNRYDDFETTTPSKTRPRSPEPRLVARALYNFVGQTARELTFRKGDLIYVRRQVDKNWYEGELNAMVGLFPVNYVEIVPYDASKTAPRKSHEGQARAKFNFVAQTHLELSLAKGELVTITRRVDDNWFEGKIGGRKGIFPVSYVEVLIDAQEPPASGTGPTKPVAAPAAHSLLLNGSSQGKESMGSHLYTPGVPGSQQLTTNYYAKPIQITGNGTYSSLGRQNQRPVDQTLHIETQSEPIPYRALYKYNPQNDDELELLEGDTVYVLEKCDDGWYVGSSERTGAFGTFPGNYVEKI